VVRIPLMDHTTSDVVPLTSYRLACQAGKRTAGPPHGGPAVTVPCGCGASYFSLTTFSAAGPFWPCTTSNSTRSPSARLLKP
jgi:hypothetical protein